MRTLRIVFAMAIATISVGALAPSVSAESTDTVPPAQEAPVGGIGLRLMEAPVSAGDDPRARVYLVDHLTPGTTIERQIEVSNTTASSQSVSLYAAAATIENGSFVGAAGATPNELSTWTSVSPDSVDIAADGTFAATVVIAVPADAAPGEQYGVIWAEARSDPGTGGGVVQVSRVGIRLYVSVGPGGAPAADFTIELLTAARSAEGLPVISATVRNTGGRALDVNGTLLLSNGPGGLTAGPFAVDLGQTLAIGDTQPLDVTLDDSLPAGPWEASITLESGLTKRTVEATVTFPDSGTAAPVPTSPASQSTRSTWLIAVVAVVALLVAIGVGLALRRRRQRRRGVAASQWAAPAGVAHPTPSVPTR